MYPTYFSRSVALGIVLTVCSGLAVAASATSDVLIVLSADGRSHTLQQTIASDGPLVALQLPEANTIEQFDFLGPNQNTHREIADPLSGAVEFWDGVALLRYHDEYEDEVTQTGPHTYRLSVPSLPQNFAVENGDITRSSFTWVFPPGTELLSYSAVSDEIGQWRNSAQELAYQQADRFAVTLTIEYRLPPVNAVASNSAEALKVFCVPTASNPELCADDNDNDGVPDYRDVCLLATQNDDDAKDNDSLSPNSPSASPVAEISTTWQEDLGCSSADNLVISDVLFPSGFSYLDVPSRQALDRVAEALQKTEGYFEIGAHTDNAGNAKTNLALANKRAETVRYYLLLKGVQPNQIRAKGYGEQYPIADNATATGRRTNRRVELTRLE